MEALPVPDAREVSLSPRKRNAFKRFLPRATEVLTDRSRALRTAKLAYKRLQKQDGGMQKVAADMRVLIRLVQRTVRGQYRLPWRSLVYAMSAILYFLSPLDLIPDFLLGIGYVDDVAVVFGVLNALRDDLARFVAWEQRADAPPRRPRKARKTAS
ncbi:MAG TPA: YkvA family protein [Rhodothermales bacterium]|nr:YkvA family protein [Rhodothermales bacterium]